MNPSANARSSLLSAFQFSAFQLFTPSPLMRTNPEKQFPWRQPKPCETGMALVNLNN